MCFRNPENKIKDLAPRFVSYTSVIFLLALSTGTNLIIQAIFSNVWAQLQWKTPIHGSSCSQRLKTPLWRDTMNVLIQRGLEQL